MQINNLIKWEILPAPDLFFIYTIHYFSHKLYFFIRFFIVWQFHASLNGRFTDLIYQIKFLSRN